MLSEKWCNRFKVDFVSYYPDVQFFWTTKKDWIIHASLENFQRVRNQNLCAPIIPMTKSSERVGIKDERLRVVENVRVEIKETCEVISTNVIMSTSSVVSCDMQVAFEEREPPIVQPASQLTSEEHAIVPSVVPCAMQVAFEEREPSLVQPAPLLQEDESLPTTSEEIAIAMGTDLELQPTSATFCESNNLFVDSCDITSIHISAPRGDLQISNYDHVVLITHKEVLARIPLDTIVCYVMLEEPMNMSCALDKISEISYLRSGTHACCFTVNLIGDYSMNDNFLVDHICITYDKIDELKRAVFSPIAVSYTHLTLPTNREV